MLKPADPTAPPLMQGFISFIDSVTAKDATTAEFKLKYPFALFAQRIAVIKILPKAKTADAAASKAFDTAPIGSGPFKLDSASKESGLKLSKNPNYNGPRPAKVDDDDLEHHLRGLRAGRRTSRAAGSRPSSRCRT